MPSVAILLPVFNEAENLPVLLERIDAALTKKKISYQAIAVDDHSSDDSPQILRKLAKKYPLQVYTKKGLPGKAFSILQAARHADSELLCMLDADGQYPPEAIPEMIRVAQQHGVVVAKRKTYDSTLLRRVGSRLLAFVFGKLLLNIDVDMQSGLKVFQKSILEQIPQQHISAWALDLPLLYTAREMGHTIGEVDIVFEKRQHGTSKLNLLGPTLAISGGAIKLKLRTSTPRYIQPTHSSSMIGAGVVHNRQHYITHTTLKHNQSAMTTITNWQRNFILSILIILVIGFIWRPLTTAQVVIALLSFVYFIDVVFNFFLILKSLHSPPEITSSVEELNALKPAELPTYTVLCPLYKEVHVLPHFLKAIAALDWPHKKLDVILLFEEDDTESIEALKNMDLPSYVRAVIVPHSLPKTKPKACNYGLGLAKGEYVVIYDAEDVPDPQQLKKAYLAFQKVGPKVKCLQAKLNYYNPHQNWLTRFFTAEYSLWFDVILTGLQSIETSIPLGGTSNHFRTKDLHEIEGWDPFNVTEDCDLGIRLFKRGYKTAIIDSTTLEEANSNAKNWIRQRSRWIKGYMQTYLIHMRNPLEFAQEEGIHALFFQLTIGGKLAFILINPILWVMTIAYFVWNPYIGAQIESLYPNWVFYMAATSLVFGNFMYIYYYMIGCAKRDHWTLMKWIFLVPIYWLMVSIAALIALYQLIVMPHYWEKTVHGLHLKKTIKKSLLPLGT